MHFSRCQRQLWARVGLVSECALWHSLPRRCFRLLVQMSYSFSMLCFTKGCSKLILNTKVLQGGENTPRFFKTELVAWSFASLQTLGCGFHNWFVLVFPSHRQIFFCMVSLFTAPEVLDQTSLEVLGFSLLIPVLTSSKLHFRDTPSLFRGKCFLVSFSYSDFIPSF